MNSNEIGDRAEANILTKLLGIYRSVSIPFGNNTRFDFIVEDYDGSLKRIQCKSATYIEDEGNICFNTSSRTTINGKQVSKTYHGQIDYFAVYCHEFNGVYLVPIEDVAPLATTMRLKMVEPKRKSTVKQAEKYLLS